MATPVELAVIELQILVREFNRRLGGLERRLGVEPEPRTERVGGQPVHRPLDPPPRSVRVSETAITAMPSGTKLRSLKRSAGLKFTVMMSPEARSSP